MTVGTVADLTGVVCLGPIAASVPVAIQGTAPGIGIAASRTQPVAKTHLGFLWRTVKHMAGAENIGGFIVTVNTVVGHMVGLGAVLGVCADGLAAAQGHISQIVGWRPSAGVNASMTARAVGAPTSCMALVTALAGATAGEIIAVALAAVLLLHQRGKTVCSGRLPALWMNPRGLEETVDMVRTGVDKGAVVVDGSRVTVIAIAARVSRRWVAVARPAGAL